MTVFAAATGRMTAVFPLSGAAGARCGSPACPATRHQPQASWAQRREAGR